MSQHNASAEMAPCYGRILVAATVVISFGGLYGISLATDPLMYCEPASTVQELPSEAEYWRVPDTSHNERIFAMRSWLQDRGFVLSGARVAEDPLASVRGFYSFVSPEDECFPVEWRLMATRYASCQPTSFLRLAVGDEGFTPEIVDEALREWNKAKAFLPEEVIATGDRVAYDVLTEWQFDKESGADLSRMQAGRSGKPEPRWLAMPRGGHHYRLRRMERVGDYQLEFYLIDRCARPGGLPSSEFMIHFRWMKSTDPLPADRQAVIAAVTH